MTEIVPFRFEGAELRSYLIDGEPWFVASDVAQILGYSATAAMTRRLDDDEKGVRVLHTLGGDQNMVIISESGLFSAILGSQVEGAKKFKRWITHEVLPQIRRTGSFVTRATPLELAERLVDAEKRVIAQAARADALEGPAAHAETFRAAEGLRTIGDVANDFIAYCRITHPTVKVLHTVVWDHAHRVGLVHRGKTVRHNEPTSQAIRAGWATPHRVEYDTRTTGTRTKVTTRLTPRGEARLWDAMVAFVLANGTLDIAPKAIAS